MRQSKSVFFARDYVFWPSLTAQIKAKVSSFAVCNAFRNRQHRQTLHLHPHDIPGLPYWQVVGTDLFEYDGQTYLLVTDCYSKYFEIEQLRQTTAICVINNLKRIFARFGIPEKVVSDNGPQYNTPEICSAITTSSRNSLKSGDFPIQPAHQTILNQMAQQKEFFRPQDAFLRRLQQRTKTHLRDC